VSSRGGGPEIRRVAYGQRYDKSDGRRESEGQDRHTRSRRGEVKMVVMIKMK
jgi:hypothetical protein